MTADLHIGRVDAPTWEDLGAIAGLDREAFGEDGLTAANLGLLGQAGRLYVAREEGKVIGQALVIGRVGRPEAFLFGLAVTAARRGRGLGARLLRAIVADLAAAGITSLDLTVEPGNHAAVRLYEKEGFTRTAEIPDLLGPGRPRLIMRRPVP